MVRRDSENCHLNLSLSAVCDCGIYWSYSLTFLMSLLLTVSNKSCLEKNVTKLYELCHEPVIMPCLFLTVLLG